MKYVLIIKTENKHIIQSFIAYKEIENIFNSDRNVKIQVQK